MCRAVLVTQICLVSATPELRGNCCQSLGLQVLPIFRQLPSTVTVPRAVTLAAKERSWLGTPSQLQSVVLTVSSDVSHKKNLQNLVML